MPHKKVAALLTALLLALAVTFPIAPSAHAATTDVTIETIDTSAYDLTFSDRELEGTWEDRDTITVTATGDTFKASGKGAKLKDGQLYITAEGVYVISGSLTIPVVIEAGKKDKVQLVLQDVEIAVTDGPAIRIEEADKVFITLPEGTTSTITDGAAYTDTDTGSPDAAIFSHTDLCFNGAGTLVVNGQYKHGIVSKDDLIVVSCTLEVNAASTALDGKDCLMATGATITANAGTNGLRSDNAEEEGRGFIYLHESTVTVVSDGDGIQAQTLLQVTGGKLHLTTGGGATKVLTNATGSWKGLKSAGDMLLEGDAEVVISSKDDCIHANRNVFISGGNYDLSSGDDGVHADTNLTVMDGTFYIRQSYEGMEASRLMIAGGAIAIIASDDGLNAAGGKDGSAAGSRAGRGFFSNGIGEIIITGGYTWMNTNGDGIDSNGTILVTGGVTLVCGPTSSMNAAFDYDGTATVTGGILIATGASGMAQNFSQAENQGAILLTFSKSITAPVALVDENGTVIASFAPLTKYQSIVITAPGIQRGGTYTFYTNAEVEGADYFGFAQDTTFTGGTAGASITMTSMIYGSGFGGFGGGSGGGPGGW